MTECSAEQLEFHALGRRAVVGEFDGGMISSDGGGLLLAGVEVATGIVKRLAEQFFDHRDPDATEPCPMPYHCGPAPINRPILRHDFTLIWR